MLLPDLIRRAADRAPCGSPAADGPARQSCRRDPRGSPHRRITRACHRTRRDPPSGCCQRQPDKPAPARSQRRTPCTVTDVQKLGAATVVVGYDPASLKPVACQRGPAFDVGVCNRTYDRDGDGTADAVFFTVLSLNGVSTPTGTAVPLVNITWQAVAAVPDERTTALTVEVRTFTDTDAAR